MRAASRKCACKMQHVNMFTELHILNVIVFGVLEEVPRLQFTVHMLLGAQHPKRIPRNCHRVLGPHMNYSLNSLKGDI